MTGTTPAELGQLTQFVELVLADNSLTGTIPTELGQLTNLEELDLDNNQFVNYAFLLVSDQVCAPGNFFGTIESVNIALCPVDYVKFKFPLIITAN